MAERPQNFKNHRRLFPLYHLFVVPVLLINALNEIRHVVQIPTRQHLWTLIVAIALVGLAFSARLMALTVQDRLIRLEMRQRLAGCLPADLQPRIADLTRGQLVALRFASDAELAELVRDVLAGSLKSGNDIKHRVTNWQADWFRA